jgi:uncharacterized metal-binding protein (TIGR02443 family)
VSSLRRFIAGAACPRCRRIDTLFLQDAGGQRLCECVACGFHDALDRAATGPTPALADPDEARPVRLVDGTEGPAGR